MKLQELSQGNIFKFIGSEREYALVVLPIQINPANTKLIRFFLNIECGEITKCFGNEDLEVTILNKVLNSRDFSKENKYEI